jgi:hypothetical protein
MWLLVPDLADVSVGGETAERPEPPSMVIGIQEPLQTIAELIVCVAVVAIDSRVLGVRFVLST